MISEYENPMEKTEAPKKVMVIGGGEVGGETAHFLTQVCQDITLIEMRDDILVDMFPRQCQSCRLCCKSR